MKEKLATWIIFSVAFSLLPLIFRGFQAITVGDTVEYSAIAGKGELLLISAALASSAIGELITLETRKYRLQRIISGGACLLLLGICSLWFADISSTIDPNKINAGGIAWWSTVFLILTIAASGAAVALKELES